MNLNDMFKDASLNNLQWMRDGINPNGLTVQPQSKDNDTKDDLQLQWNYGDIGEDYSVSPEAEKMPTPCDSTMDIVQKAREFLNQGLASKDIWTVMVQNYTPEEVKLAKKAWNNAKMANLEGIIGRIAVDVRGYRNLKDAIRHASKSPFKKFIKYVVGYTGDNIVQLATNTKKLVGEVTATGNATDDFFNSDNKSASKTAYVKELMLPMLAHSFDLDDSEADQTLIELNGSAYLTQAEVKTIKTNNKTAYSRIKAAFNLIDQKKQNKLASEYKGRVEIAEHVIKKADNEIDFANPAMPDVFIDDVALPVQENVIMPADDTLGQVEVEKDCGMLAVASAEKKNLKFDLKKSSVDVQIGQKKEASIEVEANTFHEAEFEGTDLVDLDDEKKPEAPLDIAGLGDFSF